MYDIITEARIARALKSGPPAIRDGAKVIDMDADGNITVLREGTNGWTCMPGVEIAKAFVALESDAQRIRTRVVEIQHDKTRRRLSDLRERRLERSGEDDAHAQLLRSGLDLGREHQIVEHRDYHGPHDTGESGRRPVLQERLCRRM